MPVVLFNHKGPIMMPFGVGFTVPSVNGVGEDSSN